MNDSNSQNPEPDNSRSKPASSQTEAPSGRRASAGRKLAEWVTLAVSCVLVFGLAAFLLVQALKPHSKFVAVRATPRFEHVEKQGSQYFLPIEIENRGQRTIREVNIEVKWVEQGKAQSRDVLVNYLGEKSRQTTIVILERDPQSLRIEAAPTFYRLD